MVRELLQETDASIFKDGNKVVKVYDEKLIKLEGDILNSLNHKNIIKVIKQVKDELHLPWYKYDLVDYMECHQLTEQEIREMMRKISSALKHIHEEGWIHKDIKPNNIVFNRPSNPILIDFGLTEKVEAKKYPVSTTLGYAAPEMLFSSDFDQRVDIFSLGCLYYFIKTGKEFIDADYYIHQLDLMAKRIPCKNFHITENIVLNNNLVEIECDVMSEEENEMLMSMVDLDPETRADIDSIIDFFTDKKEEERVNLTKDKNCPLVEESK